MISYTKKQLTLFFIFLIFLGSLVYVSINEQQKYNAEKNFLAPITVNLLTSVHPSLRWSFEAVKKKIIIKPGEVTTIEYIVENLDDNNTSGIATFSYYPNQFGNYISKLNCFCYDAQALKPRQKDTYSLVLLIDPEVTNDSKTKNIKEVTIQFTFFDYKKYKEGSS